MRTHLSAHVSNDDPRFERTSGLPRDYFKPQRMSPDAIVFVVCLVGLAVLLIVTRTL